MGLCCDTQDAGETIHSGQKSVELYVSHSYVFDCSQMYPDILKILKGAIYQNQPSVFETMARQAFCHFTYRSLKNGPTFFSAEELGWSTEAAFRCKFGGFEKEG